MTINRTFQISRQSLKMNLNRALQRARQTHQMTKKYFYLFIKESTRRINIHMNKDELLSEQFAIKGLCNSCLCFDICCYIYDINFSEEIYVMITFISVYETHMKTYTCTNTHIYPQTTRMIHKYRKEHIHTHTDIHASRIHTSYVERHMHTENRYTHARSYTQIHMRIQMLASTKTPNEL